MRKQQERRSGRQWLVAVLAVALGLTVAGCSASVASNHEHEWEAETCETPRVCKTCGETDGEPLGHTWQEATCLAPKTCTVCGKTEGKKSEDHVWSEATCTEREKCVLCGRVNFHTEPLGHDWIAPTLEAPYWRGGNTVRTYKHLTMTDRLRIEKWLKMGMKPREVADKLRVHVSTIYRELKRGAYDRLDGGTWEVKTAYSPDIAEEKYQAHLREKGPDLKIGNDHELANYIETTILDKDCSPAAVLGFAMIEGKKFKTSLSVPTIYKYIAKGLFLNLTQEELPRHGKKKHKYKKVKKNKSASRAPAGESIEQRPEEIDEREEFGHWEGDTVYSGKGKRKTTRALLTLTERKTRKEIIIAIPNRKAETVVKALDALERKLGARRFRAIFKSITFDNGTEFAAAEELERSCINKHLPRTKVYFCHPYSSWERGTNENTNGMIRRRFPKGTNFAAVTNAQIAQAENWINNYPRKILGYKSSEIVFRECLRELGIAA